MKALGKTRMISVNLKGFSLLNTKALKDAAAGTLTVKIII